MLVGGRLERHRDGVLVEHIELERGDLELGGFELQGQWRDVLADDGVLVGVLRGQLHDGNVCIHETLWRSVPGQRRLSGRREVPEQLIRRRRDRCRRRQGLRPNLHQARLLPLRGKRQGLDVQRRHVRHRRDVHAVRRVRQRRALRRRRRFELRPARSSLREPRRVSVQLRWIEHLGMPVGEMVVGGIMHGHNEVWPHRSRHGDLSGG